MVMMTKRLRALLIVSLAFTSSQTVLADWSKKKKICRLIAKKACINSLCANSATIGNLTATNSFTLGSGGGITTGSGILFGSIIPYSSGLITLGSTEFPLGLPTSGLVMAFGSSNLQGIVDPGVTVTDTAYAFTSPSAGTIHNLQVSVDSIYAVGAPSTPFSFTFTVLRSPCTAGSLTPYTSTGISATASTTAPAGPITILTAGGAGCGSSAASFAVAAGDRIVLRVTPNTAITDVTLANLAFSAGLIFTPA